MKTKRIIMIIAIILVIVLIGLVGYTIYQKATFTKQNPVATMEIEGLGTMKIELYPDQAPNTVANFITLANRGFYDGLTFHRIVKDFMVQGGDKEGTGSGAPTLSDIKDDGSTTDTYAIRGEFVQNGFNKNTLRHEKGVISMARSDYSQMGLYEEGYNSAGSQFFIMTGDNASLNGYYAAFGKVIEGMDVLDKLNETEVTTSEDSSDSEASTPVNPPVITGKTGDYHAEKKFSGGKKVQKSALERLHRRVHSPFCSYHDRRPHCKQLRFHHQYGPENRIHQDHWRCRRDVF